MMFVTKKALPRRTVLRGMGVTLALPLLGAMVPSFTALAQTPARPVRRLGYVYHPIGTIQDQWVPTGVGRDFGFSPILRPLERFRERLVVLSGLDHIEAASKGDGQDQHSRAAAVWLSGVHAYSTAYAEEGVPELGTTADQIAARELGKDVPLSSLEIALEAPSAAACDSGDCFYGNTLSWRSPSTPLPMETHPRVVFERLFGEDGTPSQRRARTRRTGSILDWVTQEAGHLNAHIGAGDRTKLAEYLDAVRDVEGRVQRLESRELTEMDFNSPTETPDLFEDRARLMFDLLVLAFQADITRVFTVMTAREASPMTYPQIGVAEQHHAISHHMNTAELMGKKAKIDTYMVTQFAYLLEKLQAAEDGDGTLLDNSLLLYGSGMGNSNLHSHTNLPCLLAGGASGNLRGGRHLAYPEGTPKSNLLLTMLDKVGVPTPERIGDSTEHLTI